MHQLGGNIHYHGNTAKVGWYHLTAANLLLHYISQNTKSLSPKWAIKPFTWQHYRGKIVTPDRCNSLKIATYLAQKPNSLSHPNAHSSHFLGNTTEVRCYHLTGYRRSTRKLTRIPIVYPWSRKSTLLFEIWETIQVKFLLLCTGDTFGLISC